MGIRCFVGDRFHQIKNVARTKVCATFLVYPTGVEPATLGVGVLRSIQLSYGYISLIYYTKIFRKSKEFLHIPEKFSV